MKTSQQIRRHIENRCLVMSQHHIAQLRRNLSDQCEIWSEEAESHPETGHVSLILKIQDVICLFSSSCCDITASLQYPVCNVSYIFEL